MNCNYYNGKCLFLNGSCIACPIKRAYTKGVINTKKDYDRPHGEWKEVDIKPLPYGGYTCNYQCNKCNYFTKEYHLNFCPNCGLPMTEKALEILRKKAGDQNE